MIDRAGVMAGWQGLAGAQGDRDLRFFDVMLASLRAEFHLDEKRIYATGHSNGGLFTYLLWAERGDTFAALAPSARCWRTVTRNSNPSPSCTSAARRIRWSNSRGRRG